MGGVDGGRASAKTAALPVLADHLGGELGGAAAPLVTEGPGRLNGLDWHQDVARARPLGSFQPFGASQDRAMRAVNPGQHVA
jgi:hypothetical protein